MTAQANQNAKTRSPSAEQKIGDRMPDGTILAGVSPDSGKPMYVTSADAYLKMSFKEVKEYAASLDAHGHQDWRVPSKAELNVLFDNRAAIGGFNTAGCDPADWYWSASQDFIWLAWCQRFTDGTQGYYVRDGYLSLRPVR